LGERAEGDKVPILLEVKEDKKRIIDLSLMYSGMRNMNFDKKSQTVNGKLKSIVARSSWTNYNAFGGGEKLRFIIEGTPVKIKDKRADYAFEIGLTQPDVFMKDNYVDYVCSRRQELTNIFFKKTDKIAAMLNYRFRFFSIIRAGCCIERNYVDSSSVFFERSDTNKRYDNVTIPIEFVLDRTDDLLNPTSGYRASTKFSTSYFMHSSIKNLQSLEVDFSYNHPLDEFKKTVVAFNLSKKILLGKNVNDIPVDKRIYAGGMNSVRGYANQLATEKIIGHDTHMGGKGVAEFKAEIRRKVSENFGAVLFFDGARIFQNKPNHANLQIEKKRWFLSLGVGIRYFTSIGPVRIDFAFPIKKRKGVDSKMQFIISLGQAF
jgi:translocation and assembly module TamA